MTGQEGSSLPAVRFSHIGGRQGADGGIQTVTGLSAQPKVSQLVSMYNFSARAMLTDTLPKHRVRALVANQSLMFHYKSVPPRTGPAYSLPEMFSPSSRQTSFHSPTYSSHSKGRTSTKPNVVGLDPKQVIPSGRNRRSHSRGVNGFFPPVKLRGSMQDMDIKKHSRVGIMN